MAYLTFYPTSPEVEGTLLDCSLEVQEVLERELPKLGVLFNPDECTS